MPSDAENRREPSDEELARRAVAGDDDAFRDLTVRHSRRLLSRIHARLSAPVQRKLAASDVLQDVYVGALEGLPEFEDRGDGSFAQWLAGIVEHKVQDALRRHAYAEKRSVRNEVTRSARPATEAFAGRDPSASQVCQGNELQERVRRAFEELSDSHRQVLEMLQERRLTIEEAARELDRSADAVRRLYGRALTRLEELAGIDTDDAPRRRPTR